MPLLYFLLFVTPFHSDPRMGMVLLNAGIAIVTPIKILGLLTVAAALIAPRPKDAAPHLPSSLAALFLPFAVVPVVATLAYGLPVPTRDISQLFSAALLFVAIIRLVRTEERMVKVVRALVIGFAFGSLWIYKSHFIGHELRASGLEQDGNYDALILLMTLPLSFWMIRYEENWWWRRIGLACGLLLACAVVLTESRAAIIAGCAMGLFAAVRTRRKLIGVTLMAGAAVLLFSFHPSGLVQRFESIQLVGQPHNGAEESARIHFELVKAALRIIEAHPMFGVGLEQFHAVAPDYNPELFKLSRHRFIAHDTFLQIASEAGLPALLLFLAMLGVAFRNLRVTQRSSNERLAALGLAMTISLLGISIAGLSITAEFLPFCIIILLSQSLREVTLAMGERAEDARIMKGACALERTGAHRHLTAVMSGP